MPNVPPNARQPKASVGPDEYWLVPTTVAPSGDMAVPFALSLKPSDPWGKKGMEVMPAPDVQKNALLPLDPTTADPSL